MKAHEGSTGVPYCDVIVFPQGRFSVASLGVLKSHNYLAAVNSTVVPEDLGEAHGLRVADLLVPAVSKYGRFPLFMRRYPGEIADVALDLFLGKPALLVEHHSYFRNGYGAIGAFITQMNSLSRDLQWTNLGQVLSNTYLQRRISEFTIECKMVTKRQTVHNLECVGREYIVLKDEDNAVPIRNVLVDGRPYPYVVDGGQLRVCVYIAPQSTVEVTINYDEVQQDGMKVASLRRNAKVGLRRYLSELRDNHVCRHEWLLSLVSRVKDRRVFRS